MDEIFEAKIPITYTENIKKGEVSVNSTCCIGYLYTPNLLKSMQEHNKIVEECLKR